MRFHNIHKGELAIVVCNGPSLNKTDFELIRNEITFGLNKIYLGFKRFQFYPRYYVAINKKVIEQSWHDIQDINCIRFIRRIPGMEFVKESALTHLIEPTRDKQMRFSKNICEGVNEGYTVTSSALQIANFMGIKR